MAFGKRLQSEEIDADTAAKVQETIGMMVKAPIGSGYEKAVVVAVCPSGNNEKYVILLDPIVPHEIN